MVTLLTERLLKENIIVILLCAGMWYMAWIYNSNNERVFQLVENNTKAIERFTSVMEAQPNIYIQAMENQYQKTNEILTRLEIKLDNQKKK